MVLGNRHNMRIDFIARLRARCRACGFTLIELMVTLAVAAILATIAVPSFRHLMISTNLSGLSNDLVGDLQYARTQAVSRQVDVAVAASGGSWQNGWVVEVAPGGTAANEVLRRHDPVTASYAIDNGGVTEVKYRAQGSLADPTTGTCFAIYAPNGQNNQPLYLNVSSVGSLQQATGPSVPTGCTAPP